MGIRSGHGTCESFICTCFVGYFGDDCRHTFAAGGSGAGADGGAGGPIIPILGAGDYNLTAKNFTKATKRARVMVVGFSSPKCHKCIAHERAYADAARRLKALGVPFARADADALRGELRAFSEVPP